jgi:hypothetical protein
VIRLKYLQHGLCPAAEESINDDVRVTEFLEQQDLRRPHGVAAASNLQDETLHEGRPGLATDQAGNSQTSL